MAHVLAVTPCNRLQPETIRALFTQTYAGALSHVFMRDNPEPVPGQNIIRAYRRLREIFLGGPYDAIWTVENDILPPPDALDRLLAVEADIVYGVYCFRRGTPVVNITSPTRGRDSLTDQPAAWAKAFAAGQVVDCGGLGLGCTLIHRRVLERLEFRSEGGGGDADSCLAKDAPAAGFTQRAHLGVVCGHKRTDGGTVWPAGKKPFYQIYGAGTPQLQAVRVLRSFADFGQGGRPYQAGDLAEIDVDTAASLRGAGVVEYTP